jgi:hypothetical protein
MKLSGKVIFTGIAVILVAAAIWGWLALAGHNQGTVPWSGADEIIGKIAADAGRPAHEPLINTDQGDLVLFVFTLAGTAAGFISGYFWRKLFSEKAKK